MSVARDLIDRLRGKPAGRRIEKRLMPHGARAKGTTTPDLPMAPDAFHVNDGPHYIDVLQQLHLKLKPDWYLEVGSRSGRSLALAQRNYVAIDPVFERFPDRPVNGYRMHFLAMTSDAVFESGFLAREEIRPAFGFLDGMHLAEFLMRDFMNFEAAATPGATVALHDCVPTTHAMETRDDSLIATGKPWTGDVWKVLWWVATHRPDLEINVLDAWPTGLVVIRGLDPQNRVLPDLYDRFVAEMGPVRLADFGVDRFFSAFKIQSSHRFVTDLPARP
jgi:hypothetical protein